MTDIQNLIGELRLVNTRLTNRAADALAAVSDTTPSGAGTYRKEAK